ncbi:pilus assembly protein [Streptomyces sp. RB6PN25]|uniref:Pilus assembly protein n=1 Tax=Streptomyces humicola TaxID=2953240 RepID=A0ABT1Q394_9ACTN|nr:TadE/TadG family type IV pilus assembly protein [Streptomyces humicola]MCQ4084396.1 pilus assembly protein [Streptomyces humicola]
MRQRASQRLHRPSIRRHALTDTEEGIHRRAAGLWRTEEGSAATELVVVTPLLVLVLLVMVALGRLATARLRVDDAAHQAGRAATLARTPDQARRQAGAAAGAALSASSPACTRSTVQTDTGAFAPGGVVRVTVACTAALGVVGLPGHVTITRTAVSAIDSHRGVSR